MKFWNLHSWPILLNKVSFALPVFVCFYSHQVLCLYYSFELQTLTSQTSILSINLYFCKTARPEVVDRVVNLRHSVILCSWLDFSIRQKFCSRQARALMHSTSNTSLITVRNNKTSCFLFSVLFHKKRSFKKPTLGQKVEEKINECKRKMVLDSAQVLYPPLDALHFDKQTI